MIGLIVTDRHHQISKWIQENMIDSTHRYDVWHLAKGTVHVNVIPSCT